MPNQRSRAEEERQVAEAIRALDVQCALAIEHLTLVTATMADRFPVGVHPEVITAAQRAWIKHVQYKIAESTTSLPRQRQS